MTRQAVHEVPAPTIGVPGAMHATIVVPRSDPVRLCASCLNDWKRLVNERLTAALAEFLGATRRREHDESEGAVPG